MQFYFSVRSSILRFHRCHNIPRMIRYIFGQLYEREAYDLILINDEYRVARGRVLEFKEPMVRFACHAGAIQPWTLVFSRQRKTTMHWRGWRVSFIISLRRQARIFIDYTSQPPQTHGIPHQKKSTVPCKESKREKEREEEREGK